MNVDYAAYADLVRKAEEADRLREAVEEYADHQSWRCKWPDRYPWDPDCPCGLVGVLKELGIQAQTPVAE